MKVQAISHNCCPKPKPKMDFRRMNEIFRAEKLLKSNGLNKNLLDINLFS